MKLIKSYQKTDGMHAYDVVEYKGALYDRVHDKIIRWHLKDDICEPTVGLEKIYLREKKLKRILNG